MGTIPAHRILWQMADLFPWSGPARVGTCRPGSPAQGQIGISRYAKYRALAWLREAGVIAIKDQ